MNEKTQLRMKVIGAHTMHCAGCECSIEFTLAQFTEVSEVKADWKTQTVQIDLKEEQIAIGKIKEELAWIGYEVEVR